MSSLEICAVLHAQILMNILGPTVEPTHICVVSQLETQYLIHSLTASTRVLLPESTGTISAPFFLMARQLTAWRTISLVPINILHLRPNFFAAILSILPAYPAPVSPIMYFFLALLHISA